MSRGFWPIAISFAGSQTKRNKRRQVLASAVCYGSLTYTRWKGFGAVIARLKEQRRECRETKISVDFFPFREWICALGAFSSILLRVFGVRRLRMKRQEKKYTGVLNKDSIVVGEY